MDNVVSPFNTTNCVKLKTLRPEYINRKLSNYLGTPLKNEVTEVYDLFECESSGLIFASPMVAGSSDFYDEIGRFSWYYSKHRWEWEVIENQLSTDSSNLKLLDVGCGSGVFMQRLAKKFNKAKISGIDFSEASVSEAVALGLSASTESIQDLKQKKLTFNVICLMHVLEHVEDPVALINEIKNCILATDGMIYISTPNSPMSFEHGWYDPLNHPPHHLTRWNCRAYKYLADTVGAELEIFLSPSKKFTRRVVEGFRAKNDMKSLSRKKIVAAMLRNPLVLMKTIKDQTGLSVEQCSDTVLVKLKF